MTGLSIYIPSIFYANTILRHNALNAEYFSSILKTECIYRTKLKTYDEARILIDEYFYFYNHQRIQLKAKLTAFEKRIQYAA